MFRSVIPRANSCLRHVNSSAYRGFCSRPRRLTLTMMPTRGWFGDEVMKLMEGHSRRMDRMMEDMSRPWLKAFDKWPSLNFEYGDTKNIQVTHNKNHFEVKLDVENYEPDDLEVKVVDRQLTISGKCEQKSDKVGLVSQEFTRVLQIPEDVDSESLETLLTSDGYLVVSGKVTSTEPESRRIEIKRPLNNSTDTK
nr:small heat shock protein [Bonellia viridis]